MLRAAVIGVGSWGQNHARAYARNPEVKLIGVADSDRERARSVADELSVAAFESSAELLDRVDAVSIAVPTRDHTALGELFLSHGVHVLLEKPMCRTLQEADRLLAAAAKSGAVLQVGQLERFNPAFVALKPLLRQPRFFEVDRLNPFTPRSLDIDVILDLMIHDLDLIGYMVPAPLADVRAVGIPILTAQVDIANARLEFADGCVANVTASRVSLERTRKVRLFQAHQYVSADLQSQQVLVAGLVDSDDPPGRQVQARLLPVTPGEPLEEEIRAFLETAQGRAPNPCTGAEARRALEIALEVQRTMKAAKQF